MLLVDNALCGYNAPVRLPVLPKDLWIVRVNAVPSRWERGAYGVGVLTYFFTAYGFANRWVPMQHAMNWSLPVDEALPLVPEFVWPFYLTYVLVPLTGLWAQTRSELVQRALAFVVLITVSVLLFFLVPVQVPRPSFVPDTFSGRWLKVVYATDRPVCGFPSLHVGAVVLATLQLGKHNVGRGLVFLPFALVTILATVLVKQHVVADIVGAVILVALVDWAVARWGERVVQALTGRGVQRT